MKKTAVLLIHSGYWLLFGTLLLTFFFFVVFVPAHTHLPDSAHHNDSLLSWLRLMFGFAVVPGLCSFYSCYTFLFGRLLSKQKFVLFLGGSFLCALTGSLIGAGLESLPFMFGRSYLFNDGYASAVMVILIMTVVAWINGMMGAVIKGCLTWYRDIRLKEELHRKNIETELALVKSQIDPHFLFNTINNIDVLISRDAAAASVYLNKLSGIMRFLLYETKSEHISLERELDHLQQYIDLQRIRTSNADYVDFEVSGMYTGQSIAPMVLLPFIENAFKHTEARKTDSRISISLQLSKEQLTFICTNSLYAVKKPRDVNCGLGNELIRKRLDLLYPAAHTLSISEEFGLYRVKLELQL
ncbi:Histidine kinase [Mucilaginibacter pineti]|uniref:Histidine kinase n=1 Tax=Mucilaginibacter pineti TaxID=1391627 RepID=A0A1G7EL07_9SPHI|nr:sensor histidine kinase [Mucilaginibacter pineti]SDE64302.1 Histidine kinase [Mucilaginibacter pineti]